MKVEASCPIEFQGSMVSCLSRRQAVIQGTDVIDNVFIVRCEAPLNDMFGFVTELRSATEGKGEYTMEYSRYSPVREEVAQKLIKAHVENEQESVTKKKK
ncbi:unnamed protein product [Soboliphyme baturini]|uniref:EFG_C domain-containing protein n=1 Tax=Soboliphyme baturini TaxID=241478 RepID=A0A183I988_9BILA|nr:unnamed protein product [Soboliphyme baturini]